MDNEHKTRTTRWQWLAVLGIVGTLLVTSPVPGYAHRHGHVFFRSSIVVPLGALSLLPTTGRRHTPAGLCATRPPDT